MMAKHDTARDTELDRLRKALADRRPQWVPQIARNAVYDKGSHGWRLGDISGAAGKSLLIYQDPKHRTHVDFNGQAWKGDDLALIGALSGIGEFPDVVRRAAELVGLQLPAWTRMKATGAASPGRNDGSAVMPVPADAPSPPSPNTGTAEEHEDRHCYRDRAGEVMFYVDRFRNVSTRKKRFLPWTLRRANGALRWAQRAPEKPSPLYDLDRLDGVEQVLLVEGERKADAAQELVPSGFAVLSLMGGSCNAQHQDYSPLAGLPVTAWPDNDDGGRKAMAVAMRHAAKAGTVARGVVPVPTTFPAKWDLADDWPEPGADPHTRISELIAAADLPSDPGDAKEQVESNGDNTTAVVELGEWDAGNDPGPIAPRGWLLGNQFCRRFVSALIGGGAVGKTALRIAQYLSLASGRELTGQHVFKRCRVLLLSFEDDSDELERRLEAALKHHGLTRADISGWLFCATPKGLKLAEIGDRGPRAGALESALRNSIARRKPHLVALDPFVKTHALDENSNSALDFVITLLAKLATELDIAVDVTHHTRKGLAAAGDADPGRGGGAFKDGARLVYSLVQMTPEEADIFGLSDRERRSLIRLDNAKVNLAPSAGETTWFKLVGVPLGNGTPDYPKGDEMQTVERWTPPNLWAAVNNLASNAILDKISAGLPDGRRYSDASRTGDRAAWPVVKEAIPSLTKEQCRKVIATWKKNGVLESKPYHDPKRREERQGLFVNATKRPGPTLED